MSMSPVPLSLSVAHSLASPPVLVRQESEQHYLQRFPESTRLLLMPPSPPDHQLGGGPTALQPLSPHPHAHLQQQMDAGYGL